MTNLFANIRTRVAQYREYSRIAFELRNMRTETAIDLGLFREDAELTASRAVYGH